MVLAIKPLILKSLIAAELSWDPGKPPEPRPRGTNPCP